MAQQASIESWLEWKQRCALALCEVGTQSALRHFAVTRFRGLIRRYADKRGLAPTRIPGHDIAERDAWHHLEVHLVVSQTRRGKRYKEWLFARLAGADNDPLDVIQGGAFCILRDAVRHFLHAELARGWDEAHLEAMAGRGDAEVATWLPGVPDPVDATAAHEYAALATEHARTFLEALSKRQKLALLARQTGMALSSATVRAAADCGRSTMTAAWHEAVELVASDLRRRYPDDDSESVQALCLLTLQALGELLQVWAEAEDELAALVVESETPPLAVCATV